MVIFNFDRSPKFRPEFLKQVPPHREEELDIFSIYSSVRPNSVGMSVLEVVGVEGATIRVRRLDMVEGTPILRIKPYIEDRRQPHPS